MDDAPVSGIGARIKEARKARKLSQQGLAEVLRVTSQAVGQWERDSTRPTSARLEQIAVVLDVSLVWLLTGAGTEGAEDEAVRRAVERYVANRPEEEPGTLDSGIIAMAAVTTFDRLKTLGTLATMDGQAFWRECVANYAVLRSTLLEFGAARSSEDE